MAIEEVPLVPATMESAEAPVVSLKLGAGIASVNTVVEVIPPNDPVTVIG